MTEPFKQKTLSRLKKSKGQIEGIIKMINEDRYCIDIMAQVLALQGSLKAISHLILESHLNTCGAKGLSGKDSNTRQKFIEELIKIVKFSNR